MGTSEYLFIERSFQFLENRRNYYIMFVLLQCFAGFLRSVCFSADAVDNQLKHSLLIIPFRSWKDYYPPTQYNKCKMVM